MNLTFLLCHTSYSYFISYSIIYNPLIQKNVSNLSDVTKKTNGRQKIKMKKISNKCNLQVMFLKCQTGVFKKTSELATLCGVDLAVIMFSPNNQVYSFSSPNVDFVIHTIQPKAHLPSLPKTSTRTLASWMRMSSTHTSTVCLTKLP